jgi:hypothetical protein
MAEHHMRALRASRADPPGRATDDPPRRATYNAALQQFEELLGAARVVGPASRPLPLFYALSQAGRAIVAAYGDQSVITGHGLAEDREVQPEDLLHRRIYRAAKKDGSDAFGAVARATGSGDLVSGAEIGALWAALPSSYRVPPESWHPDWRLALGVTTGFLARHTDEGVALLLTNMGGNPLVPSFGIFHDHRYPTLPSDTKAALRGGEFAPGNWIADLTIPTDEEEETVLDKIAPKAYDGDDRALIPTLPGESQLLSPLMLWWALLFALSIVARYHPGPWSSALAVEGSKQAVPLEALLAQAVDRLPPLVYQAIFLNPAVAMKDEAPG